MQPNFTMLPSYTASVPLSLAYLLNDEAEDAVTACLPR